MRHIFIHITLTFLTASCGGLDIPLSLGDSDTPSQEARFLRQSRDVRLHVGTTLQAGPQDDLDLVDLPLPLDGYRKVTCLIEGVTWTHCYTTSDSCGGGSFPTACFNPQGGLRACVKPQEPLQDDPEGSHCAATTRDGMGASGGPLEVIYCGVSAPKGRQISGWVDCQGI